MNLSSLGPAFEAHKVPILATAGVGVAGLALVKKKKKAAGDGANGAAGAAPSTAAGFVMPYSAGGQGAAMTGAAPYDSSASDLYGAVQPQLESLQNQLSGLTDRLSAAPPTPVPAPVAAPAPAPAPPAPAPAAPPTPVYQAPRYAVDTWYTVKKGDTLSGIAARFPQQSITASTIGQANGIANINRIFAGQNLHIFGN